MYGMVSLLFKYPIRRITISSLFKRQLSNINNAQEKGNDSINRRKLKEPPSSFSSSLPSTTKLHSKKINSKSKVKDLGDNIPSNIRKTPLIEINNNLNAFTKGGEDYNRHVDYFLLELEKLKKVDIHGK